VLADEASLDSVRMATKDRSEEFDLHFSGHPKLPGLNKYGPPHGLIKDPRDDPGVGYVAISLEFMVQSKGCKDGFVLNLHLHFESFTVGAAKETVPKPRQ
jgi:hypothetical protein